MWGAWSTAPWKRVGEEWLKLKVGRALQQDFAAWGCLNLILEARDGAKHPVIHRTAPATGNYSAQDVSSAEGGRNTELQISNLLSGSKNSVF